MTKEERIKNRVERELAEANERLARLHGINPNDKKYQAKKCIIRYAFDHHITVAEAQMIVAEKRGEGQLW